MLRLAVRPRVVLALALACFSTATFAQPPAVVGTVRDETGAVLPGVSIEVRESTQKTTVTDGKGNYRIDGLAPGPHQLFFSLINFGTLRRDITIAAAGPARADVVMH